MMKQSEYIELCHVFFDIAKKHILPFYGDMQGQVVYDKGHNDVVTDIDYAMEHAVTAILQKMQPGCHIVAEEAFSADRQGVALLAQKESFWVIDPLDGTRNFVKGSDKFCSMIAYIHKGEAVFSCIAVPHKNIFYYALKGEGAYTHQDVSLLSLRNITSKNTTQMCGQVNFIVVPTYKRQACVMQSKAHFQDIHYIHCAGIDFVNMALGLHDFSLYRFLWWWDHIPGLLLLKEAGGYVKRLDELSYDATKPQRNILCASSADYAKQVEAYFAPFLPFNEYNNIGT